MTTKAPAVLGIPTGNSNKKGTEVFRVTIPICTLLALHLAVRHTVPTPDLVFSIGYLLYIHLANIICFNSNRIQLGRRTEPMDPFGVDSLGKGQFIKEPAFKRYTKAFEVIAVLIPLILIFLGPNDMASTLVPSLVTLLAQGVGEQSTYYCHDVLRILVPIGFNSYRMLPLVRWTQSSYALFLENDETSWWYQINLGLALVNLVFWTYNLFGFLLLRVLPVYFDKNDTFMVEMAYTMIPLPKAEKESKGKD